MPQLLILEPDRGVGHTVLISVPSFWPYCSSEHLSTAEPATAELGILLNMGLVEREPFFSLSLHAWVLLMSQGVMRVYLEGNGCHLL